MARPSLLLLSDDGLTAVASCLDSDSLRKLARTCQRVRTLVKERIELKEWLCVTDSTDSRCYPRGLNRYAVSHVLVPEDCGDPIPSSRWAVGDVAFVAFRDRLLARRVPSGEFYDVTPHAVASGEPLAWCAGHGRRVWVGVDGAVVEATLVPDMLSFGRERRVAVAANGPQVACACASEHGLLGIDSQAVVYRYDNAAWVPLHRLNKHCDQGVGILIAAPTPAGEVAFLFAREDSTASVVVLSSVRTHSNVCNEVYVFAGEELVILPEGLYMLAGQYYDGGDGEHYNRACDISELYMRELPFSIMTTSASMTFHGMVTLKRLVV